MSVTPADETSGMSRTFACYLRTSTEERQSPEDSRAWQMALAETLIGPVGGTIVEVYHDVGVSRSVPWRRRPEASDLLRQVERAESVRGWSGIVVAEPQRAFSGDQFANVFPFLTHHGVELWVPEVGGRVDPDSEAHEIVMGLFSGLSKGERKRTQIRTRATMLALGPTGRWLGGRPNYGYRVVDTATPHPNGKKAALGAFLRTLVPDDASAAVVLEIFEMYDSGMGYRSIARALETQGFPSPGETGPRSHPRSAGVWTGSAVRAILTNPRYLGKQVVGRQQRYDELLDPWNPGEGTRSRQRWQPSDDWKWSSETAWPPLVPEELWRRVNERIKQRPRQSQRRSRTPLGQYLMSGLIRCGTCGRAMYGVTMKGLPYYRCPAARPDYAVPAAPEHPKSLSVREDRLTAVVDPWLSSLTEPDRLAITSAEVAAADRDLLRAEPAEASKARRDIERLSQERQRLLRAIREGCDPRLIAPDTERVQAELDRAEAVVAGLKRSSSLARPLSAEEVQSALLDAGGLIGLLGVADRAHRASLYGSLGLGVEYHRDDLGERVRAKVVVSSGGGRI